jgi:hypothetical protein
MKRHTTHLLQQLHSRFESSHVARRNPVPASTATRGGLHAEDGYDWLRQIKPARAVHTARR